MKTFAKELRDFIYHRSYGWKPLYGEETTPWVEEVLLEKLKKISGVEWSIPGGNLVHVRSIITLHSDNFIDDNEIAKKIRDHFPLLSNEDFGYKLERLVSRKGKKYVYEGILALNCDKIVERGRIIGEKFGL